MNVGDEKTSASGEPNGLKGASFHEAGHAVVSHVLDGRAFTLVTIVPTDECKGRVQYEPMPEWFQPDVDLSPEAEALIRTEVITFFAGSFAQGPIDGDTEAEDSSWGDFIKAHNLASYATGSNDDLETYLKECEQEAERLVKNHWSAIEALAFALLAKGTLTGDEARAIIDSSPVKLAEELEG